MYTKCLVYVSCRGIEGTKFINSPLCVSDHSFFIIFILALNYTGFSSHLFDVNTQLDFQPMICSNFLGIWNAVVSSAASIAVRSFPAIFVRVLGQFSKEKYVADLLLMFFFSVSPCLLVCFLSVKSLICSIFSFILLCYVDGKLEGLLFLDALI